MNRKGIKLILNNKLNDWLKHIDDESVAKAIREDAIITGGAIANLLLGEEINDFDVYFKTRSTTLKVAEYYTERFKSASAFKDGKEVDVYVDNSESDRVTVVVKSAGIAAEGNTENYAYFESEPQGAASQYVNELMHAKDSAEEDEEKPKYRPVFLSRNAITLSNKIQLVLRFYGSADEIHQNYDFVHCTNYWEAGKNQLTLRPDAIEALLDRRLHYVGSKYPLCSIIRTRKFINRGFKINAGQYLKMAMQLNDMDLNDLEVLREQLTGVDTAYFIEMIELLKQKDKKRVDSAYLMEVINRMF